MPYYSLTVVSILSFNKDILFAEIYSSVSTLYAISSIYSLTNRFYEIVFFTYVFQNDGKEIRAYWGKIVRFSADMYYESYFDRGRMIRTRRYV